MKRTLGLVACVATVLGSGCVSPNGGAAREHAISPDNLGLDGAVYHAPEQDWWLALDDPQLDRLERQALAGNPGLAAALARVRSAREQSQIAGAGNKPQLSLDGFEYRERVSEHYIFPPPYAGSTLWQGELGANFAWNLDFWGRQAALIDQSRQLADAASLDAAGTSLLLSSSVAQSYVELARADRLLLIAEEAASQRDRIRELAAQRVRAGLDTEVELRGAEANRALVDVDMEQARLARDAAIHALAALTGHGADAYAHVSSPGLDFERALGLPAALPADLLAHRPDIAAAQMRVAAAQSARSVAQANFYPNINLNAFAGFQSIGLDQLFVSGSHTWSVGPAIHLPLFDAGRLKAEYRKSGADADAAVAAYNETVLRAVRETSDQVSRVASLDQQLADQQRSLTAAEQAYAIAQQRYGAGLANYLTVLNAETQVLTLRRQRVNLLADRTLARIALLVALGGSFDARQPATPLAGSPAPHPGTAR